MGTYRCPTSQPVLVNQAGQLFLKTVEISAGRQTTLPVTPCSVPINNQCVRVAPGHSLTQNHIAAMHATQVGDSVQVGGYTYEVTRQLGRGAFGVVWEAFVKGEGEGGNSVVAVKCSMPSSPPAMEGAITETQVLRQLTEVLSTNEKASSHVPQYLSHRIVDGSPGRSAVTLAMSKVTGRPVDNWLYGVDEKHLMTITMTELFYGPFPDGRFKSMNFDAACSVASCLLLQVSPVMAALTNIAYHRDISAHNFMVNDFTDATGPQLDFTIIDFGLAVHSRNWKQAWPTTCIAGDPRYWSPATWMHFVYGHKYVTMHPDQSYRRQYEERLDHFPMGVLVLEVLFVLWEGPGGCSVDDVAIRELLEVRRAWREYFSGAYILFQEFHANDGTGISKLRERLLRSRDLIKLGDNLKSLCSSLRAAAQCSSNVAVTPLLIIAADLLSANGSISWQHIPAMLTGGKPGLSGSCSEKGTAPITAPMSFTKRSHRRVWSTDQASSLVSSTADVVGENVENLRCHQASISPQELLTKPTHRRVWSIDQATSLASNTPELSKQKLDVSAESDHIEADRGSLPVVPRLPTLLEVQSPTAAAVKDTSNPPSHRLSMCSPDESLVFEPDAAVLVPKIIASRPGDYVQVGPCIYEVLRELGRGAFGIVWEAHEYLDEANCGESALVAVKCSVPTSGPALDGAVFETLVLKQLTEALPSDVDASHRLPRYLGHSVIAGAGGKSAVTLAMTKLQGVPLDKWLYGVSEKTLMKINMTELLDGPLPDGKRSTYSFVAASCAAAALLAQISPVFAALAGIAFHRDVSAHNFLVSDSHCRDGINPPEFAVLDFGLAVRAHSWCQDWRGACIGGDPRYWSPATWMHFAYGHKYLEGHPDQSFKRQYEERIDNYSLGVLVLEVLFALWSGPDAEVVADINTMRGLAEVRLAWRSYWSDAYDFFQQFHSEGGKGVLALRERLVRTQDLVHFVSKLRALCSSLRSAASLCKSQYNISPLFSVVADFLDGGGSIFFSQVAVLLESGTAGGEVCSGGEAVVVPCVQKRSHRRVWSVDQATSLVSCTPEVSAIPKSPVPVERQFSHRKQLSEYGVGTHDGAAVGPIRWRHSAGGLAAHPAPHLQRSPSVLPSRQ